jgi:hypothetical protein
MSWFLVRSGLCVRQSDGTGGGKRMARKHSSGLLNAAKGISNPKREEQPQDPSTARLRRFAQDDN